jgi:hypothetical protein
VSSLNKDANRRQRHALHLSLPTWKAEFLATNNRRGLVLHEKAAPAYAAKDYRAESCFFLLVHKAGKLSVHDLCPTRLALSLGIPDWHAHYLSLALRVCRCSRVGLRRRAHSNH